MECIELMIVVAIIGILAAIALPAYQDYVQKSANTACLGEATSAVKAAVAEMASEGKLVTTYTPSACDSAGDDTAASVEKLTAEETLDAGSLVFNPLTRGSTSKIKTTTCDTTTATCKITP